MSALPRLSRLAPLESIIERGQQTFIEVGAALLEIRDSRLYRASHATFEDYCQKRWGWTATHGRRLIEASEVAQIAPFGAIANEAQARELLPLKDQPAAIAEAWEAAQNLAEERERPVTAAIVREVVRGEIEEPPNAENWSVLARTVDVLEALASIDASSVAAAVPVRRRAATAKRLRRLGIALGRIAWTLEGLEERDDRS
jgi:hypothetical protein